MPKLEVRRLRRMLRSIVPNACTEVEREKSDEPIISCIEKSEVRAYRP